MGNSIKIRNCVFFLTLAISAISINAVRFEEDSTKTLDEFVVEAKSSAISYKGTTVVVDVAKDHLLAEKNGYTILNLLPYTYADQNGNISVMNKSVTVVINGKKMRLTGQDLKLYLQNIQGSDINTIEIETQKSASADGDDGTCILKFNTRRPFQSGNMGRIGSTYSRASKNNFSEFGSFYFFTPKVTLSAALTATQSNDRKKFNEFQVSPGCNYSTTTRTPSAKKYAYTPRVGIDIDLKQNHYIGLEWSAIFLNQRPWNSVLETTQWDLPTGNEIAELYTMNSAKSDRNILALNYKWTIDALSDLVVLADYTWNNVKVVNDYKNVYQTRRDSILYMWQPSDEHIGIGTVQADYSKFITTEWGIGAGLKYVDINTSFAQSFTESSYDDATSGIETQRNDFKYRERRGAAYVEGLFFRLPWYVKAGLRAEYTDARGYRKQEEGDNFIRHQLQWFPSFEMLRQIKGNWFGITFSSRTLRPSYGSLNPFVRYLSDVSRQTGNPELKPMQQYEIGLRSQINNKYGFVLSASRANHIINEEFYDFEGISYRRPSSGVSRDRVELYASLPFNAGIWSSNNSIGGTWDRWTGNAQTIQCWMYYFVNTVHILRWTRHFNTTLSARFVPKLKENYYESTRNNLNLSIDFSYSWLNDALTLQWGVTDLLNAEGRKHLIYRREDIYRDIRNDNISRTYYVTLSWGFSNGLKKQSRQKTQSGKEDADRI